MTNEHATTYSAESFRLLQREIDRLLSENNALRMAMGMLNQEELEPAPPTSTIATVASDLAAELIRRRLAAGHSIEIPSLGIVIDPKQEGGAS